jgi:prevent-host-death family protein
MTMVASKKQMAAAEFKAKCLQVMDQVAKDGRAVVVTKRGKPVVRIVPVEEPEGRDVLGCLADEITIVGDIESPIIPEQLWKMLK